MTNIIKYEESKTELDTLKEFAHIAYKSGNYSGMTETTMLNIMLSARDLGISPYKALNGGFYVVNGKIAMSTSLMTDRIRRDGHSVKITEMTAKKCVIIGIRKDNEDSVKIEFTWEEAIAAGLTGSPTWKKYPKIMLYNRAMSMLARILFPDVVGNCYSEDEGQEIAAGGRKKKVDRTAQKEISEPTAELLPTSTELVEEIKQNIEVEHAKYLQEYIEYCETRVSKPMWEVVNSWVANPEPFKEHYEKWVAKKIIDEKKAGDVKVGLQASLFIFLAMTTPDRFSPLSRGDFLFRKRGPSATLRGIFFYHQCRSMSFFQSRFRYR